MSGFGGTPCEHDTVKTAKVMLLLGDNPAWESILGVRRHPYSEDLVELRI